MEMHVEGMRQPTHTHEELTKEWSIFFWCVVVVVVALVIFYSFCFIVRLE